MLSRVTVIVHQDVKADLIDKVAIFFNAYSLGPSFHGCAALAGRHPSSIIEHVFDSHWTRDFVVRQHAHAGIKPLLVRHAASHHVASSSDCRLPCEQDVRVVH